MQSISRVELIKKSSQFVWIYAQTGFGKTTLLQQHFNEHSGEKLWLDNKTKDHSNVYSYFIKNSDDANSVLYIDDIHLFTDIFILQLFDNLPSNAQVIISSKTLQSNVSISLASLNQFDVINFQKLRFNYQQVCNLIDSHNHILIKDIYAMSLGWPVLVDLIRRKTQQARDIEHLKNIVNASPNSLADYVKCNLLTSCCDINREFLISLSIVDLLPKVLFNNFEQVKIEDYCEHELNGLTIYHEQSWQLLPLLKHACFISLLRTHSDELQRVHYTLAERFLLNNDIESAINLMLQIGEKERAIKYLNKMGRLLEWIQHGLTNLQSLYKLFTEEEANKYEVVAWLFCIVNYKLGNVNQSRKLVDIFWNKRGSDQLTWTVADAMIKLHEGRIFETSHLQKLQNFSESNLQAGPFTRALINNLLSVAWLQKGANDKVEVAIFKAKKFYQLIDNAKYGVTFLNIHQSHSLLLNCQFNATRQLLHKVSVEIQSHFSQDKSIRLSLHIVKLELNYLSGLLPAIRTLDQLIKKLKHNESWLDLYAILYPIAIKVALLKGAFDYIPNWFAIADSHLQDNPMEHLDELLSQLAKLVILKNPNLNSQLSRYIIKLRPFTLLPWRLKINEFEIMMQTNNYDLHLLNESLSFARHHGNTLFYLQVKAIKLLIDKPSYLPSEFIEVLQDKQFIGLLWQMRSYIPEEVLKKILQEYNRIKLFDLLEDQSSSTANILSKKEKEIYALLKENLRNKQIALELDISEQTVKFHLKNIYRKLGVKSRKEAAKCQVS
ncbi:MAG: LuxR C-terminal-related transcriptional regulator [Litorilituus sp.]|jgi:LuxR family maltose regulon positive regulatory protein|nr:LuxR C-terminal-related transcriptional regulator [Litorilituus sp.]